MVSDSEMIVAYVLFPAGCDWEDNDKYFSFRYLNAICIYFFIWVLKQMMQIQMKLSRKFNWNSRLVSISTSWLKWIIKAIRLVENYLLEIQTTELQWQCHLFEYWQMSHRGIQILRIHHCEAPQFLNQTFSQFVRFLWFYRKFSDLTNSARTNDWYFYRETLLVYIVHM